MKEKTLIFRRHLSELRLVMMRKNRGLQMHYTSRRNKTLSRSKSRRKTIKKLFHNSRPATRSNAGRCSSARRRHRKYRGKKSVTLRKVQRRSWRVSDLSDLQKILSMKNAF